MLPGQLRRAEAGLTARKCSSLFFKNYIINKERIKDETDRIFETRNQGLQTCRH